MQQLDLARLPEVQRQALEAGLVKLDVQAIRSACEEIGNIDAGLAEPLCLLDAGFRYDAMLQLVRRPALAEMDI